MKPQSTKAITRSSEGLRSTLLDALESFINGDIDHVHAKTVAKLCDSVNKSLTLDLEAARFVRETGAQSVADLGLNMLLVRPQVTAATDASPPAFGD